MPGKPPYFPLYPKDFAADGKVEAMTTEQVGAYFLLLCKAWCEDIPGSLPSDDLTLARWSRLTPDAWTALRAGILAAFELGTDGRYHQKRMRKEYRKLQMTLRGRSEGGTKGAAKRWGKAGLDPPNGLVNGSVNGSVITDHMAPGSDYDSGFDQPKTEKDGGLGEGFDEFWMAYPRKQAKSQAKKCWKRIKPDAELRAKIMAAIESQKKSEQWLAGVIANPSTWLNQERWEDEMPIGGYSSSGRRMLPPSTNETKEQRAERLARDKARAEEDRAQAKPLGDLAKLLKDVGHLPKENP